MRRALIAVVAVAALLAIYAQSAAAIGGGQIGTSFGSPGVGNGQFYNPLMFGADPVDGTLYTGDYNGAVETEASNYRIQQLSASGEFKASAEIKRFPEKEKLVGLQGIAVDHSLGRIYIVDSCRVANAGGTFNCIKIGGKFAARKILVYSTTPEAGKLVPDATLPTISLPEGANEIYEVRSIAVDPSNHDIVLLGEENAKHKIVQRVSSTGTIGNRYTDTTDQLKPTLGGGPANSLAVSPSGVAYTMTGGITPGTTWTRAWQLPQSLASLSEVPGFAAQAAKEDWPLERAATVESFYGGPQLAISSDGSTLYWKEAFKKSAEKEAGELNIRAYSLSKGETIGIWGGGSGGKCAVQSSNAALAATTGGNLAVFDIGATTAKPADSPVFGRKIATFGPSGSGCTEPIAKFTVNGKPMNEEPTGIKPGDTVSFSAASSELAGGFRKELVWKFGDGTEQVIGEPSEGVEAPATVTHVYSSAAKVTPKLQIRLAFPRYGNPLQVERTFTVGTPVAGPKLTVTKSGSGSGTVTSSPSGINCGSMRSRIRGQHGRHPERRLRRRLRTGRLDRLRQDRRLERMQSDDVRGESGEAEFDRVPKFTLKVTKTGTGSGTVTSYPPGSIAAPPAKPSSTPAPGHAERGAHGGDTRQFTVVWSGCDDRRRQECQVTMAPAKEVTATFALVSPPVTVTKDGTGTGTVTSTPAGINCGATCSANFADGTSSP